MNENYNLIFNEEDCYGFLYDIIRMLEHDLATDEFKEDEALKEALDEAKILLAEDENENKPSIYKMWYHPMGAFIFTKMIEQENGL